MLSKFFPKRYNLLIKFIGYYLLFSFLIRAFLYVWALQSMGFSVLGLIKIFSIGLMFDIGAAVFYVLFYNLYLLIVPKLFIGTLLDKTLTFIILFFTLLISVFSFMAEIPFWEEFNTRFNFIAVDYLIYTYEVVSNINESYPLPLLIGGILLVIALIFLWFKKSKGFYHAFTDKINFNKRLISSSIIFFLAVFYIFLVKNSHAELSNNIYENELSKNGTYSFMAAYRSNELDYTTFYQNLDEKKAFSILKKEIQQSNQSYLSQKIWDINRKIMSDTTESHPNIVIVMFESMSAEFMNRFGNQQNLTPVLDSLAQESIFFSNLYATGTRTVRGMEAIALCVPPTPGNSIVRRLDNHNIFSIGNVVKEKNYTPYFVYGGDGYFDNMNNFFGGQGFTIIDRNRGNPLNDNIKTQRINISDEEVDFENAWGISDGDLYKKLLQQQNVNYQKNVKSLFLVMTTSNHRPYTYPQGKIDIPIGSREGAVKYTDFALGEYLKKAQKEEWFKNTIFLFVADHCASSAGKWDINVSMHHIPAMIYNSGLKPAEINKMVSQIDLMPTLFGILKWNYNSSFYGKDIFKMEDEEQRALIGNYRTLGLLTPGYFTEINDRKKANMYRWDEHNLQMTPLKNINDSLKNKTISYYQTASLRFKNGYMKINAQ